MLWGRNKKRGNVIGTNKDGGGREGKVEIRVKIKFCA